MSDDALIRRGDVMALPAYDGDGDPAGVFDHQVFVRRDAIAALPAVQTVVNTTRVQHIRRGTTYRVLGRGQIQTDTDLRDYDEVVAYQCETDGRVWVRAAAEFDDPSRFRILAALDEQPAPDVAALVEALKAIERLETVTANGTVRNMAHHARAALAAWEAKK